MTDDLNLRLRKAGEAKTAASEALEDAWQRILTMKNSEPDLAKLKAVRQAFGDGRLGREPGSAGKRFSKAEALRLYKELAAQERESKLTALVANTPANYELVLTADHLAEIVKALQAEPVTAIDTETTGVDVYVDEIVGLSITLPIADRHIYVPVGHTEDTPQLERNFVLGKLTPYLTDISRRKVLHNANFDIQVFMRYDIEMAGLYWDTMHAMPLLNENEPSFALKNLATKYLNEPSDSFAELFGKNAKFAEVPLDLALVYAAKDTHLTWRLYEFQRKHLAKMPEVLSYYERIEVPLIYAIVAMERTGFNIDVDYAAEYGKEMLADIERLNEELRKELGDINLNSSHQLKPALEAVTKRKLDSTDAKKVLKPMAKDFPVIAKLLEYKELTKLHSTYINVLPDLVHPVTGRLHARFNPMGARTGRFSSGGNGVNLQNQPKAARKLFVAPPGWVIVGADWSQQEVRCAAYLTQEPVLLQAYEEGRDVYASMASEVYGKPYEECGDGTFERKAMKVGVLASLYGTGPGTLAQQLGITVDEAKAFLADFFDRLPGVKRWIDETQAYAKKHGFVWMDGKQRKRRLPEATVKTKGWGDPRRGEVMRALRQGPNACVQGTSAIQGKATLIKLHELCKRKGWRLWAVIHDEALVVMHEGFTREDITELEDVMVNTYKFGNVLNKTDIEIQRRWGEGMPVDEWFKQKEARA